MELALIEQQPLESVQSFVGNNYQELIESAKADAAKYKSMVVADEESVKEAKKLRAEVRKKRETIEEIRKQVKRDKLAEIEVFEDQMKDIANEFDFAWQELDDNVKSYEHIEREKKIAHIENLITEYALGFNVTWRDYWYNKGTTDGQIIDDIKSDKYAIEQQQIKEDKDIRTIHNSADAHGLDSSGWVAMYKQGQELNIVLNAMADHAKKVKEAAAEEQIEEIVEVVEVETANEEVKPVIEEIKPVIEEVSKIEPAIMKDIIVVEGTIEEFQKLKEFIYANGMKVYRYEEGAQH